MTAKNIVLNAEDYQDNEVALTMDFNNESLKQVMLITNGILAKIP